MGGSTTISTSETRIEALKLQSSAYGVTIALLYGMTRVPGNLAWYGGFRPIPHTATTSQGGKGGGVKTQNTTFTYTASLMMGICHGQISAIPRIWRGKRVHQGVLAGTTIQTATESYTPPASGAMTYTLTQAASFSALLYIRTAVLPITLSRGLDYDVTGGGVVTILNDDYRSRQLLITYQHGNPAQTALQELGLSLMRGAVGQATWSYLATNFPTQAIGYSGLAGVTAQDYDLGTGAQVENHNFEVAGPQAFSVSAATPDADPAAILLDVLTNARYGAAFPVEQLDVWSSWSDYCVAAGLLISPAITKQMKAAEVVETAARLTATAPVWSGDRLRMVPYADTAESGNGRTFTPNTTPVYELTDDHFVPGRGEPPVIVERKSPADLFNHVRLEFLNRANQYNVEIAEAKDQADIDANGLRTMETVVAWWICDAAVARKVAQILLQRSLFVAARYKFKLPVNFSLLEASDLVTLTDSGLGLSQWPVRVLSVDEDGDDGAISVEAEDYPSGTASAALYPAQAGLGHQADYNAAPGNVNTPLIFELPGELTANGLEVAVAVRGTGANWGGCRVWVSLDGTNYRQVGVTYGGARYGTLTGAISGGTLPVVLYGGQLLNGSASDAAALNTLFYIGGSSPEFGAYQTATLTGTLAYNLTGLVRGAYSSAGSAAHTTGDGFARIDDAIVRSGIIDLAHIGRTISFKFTSFNQFGGAEQSLASVTAHTYTVQGRWIYGNSGQGSGAQQFSAIYAAEFRNSAESWTAFNAALTVNADSLTITPSAGDSGIRRSGLSVNGASYDRVRARVRRVGGNGWDGTVYYTTSGHGESTSFRKAISQPPPSGWVVLEWDMSDLTAGGTDWSSNTITGLRFDFGATTSDVFEIDWVAIGRVSPVSITDLGYTGDLNATSDVALVGSSGMRISGNRAAKVAGTASAWSEQAYSRDGYAGGAYASAVLTGRRALFGLTTDPQANASYTSIDWGIQADTTGNAIRAWENGVASSVLGTWATSDVLAVTYDGANVRWMQNGTVLRTVAAAISAPLYFDSSFFDLDDDLANIRFGPLSAVNNIGTTQLQANAATQIATQINSGSGNFIGNTQVNALSFTPDVTCRAIVTIAFMSSRMSAGSTGDNGYFSSCRLYQGGSLVEQAQNTGATTESTSHTLRGEFNVTGGVTYEAVLYNQGQGIAGSGITYTNVRITVEVIKR